MKKIFRKKFFAFFLSALLVLALSLPVFADMGPKPSVTLKLYYTPGQRYAVTLLGNTRPSTAPGPPRQTSTGSGWVPARPGRPSGTTPPPRATTSWATSRNTPATADAGVRLGLLPAQQVLCFAL